MLSLAEVRGRDFKRIVRAAAALRDLYDDVALGAAVGRSRMAVARWWEGARPGPDTLAALAEVTGFSLAELTAFVYYGGPRPRIVEPESPAAEAIVEGIRRDREHQQPEDVEEPSRLPELPPPDMPGSPP